jgi:hypothetical protein
MVLPASPAVLDLRTGRVLGTPTPATRLDPLRLLAPPLPKPAEINPPAHVTVVHPPPTRTDNGATAKHDPRRWTPHGWHHGINALHPTTSGTH